VGVQGRAVPTSVNDKQTQLKKNLLYEDLSSEVFNLLMQKNNKISNSTLIKIKNLTLLEAFVVSVRALQQR